MTGATGVLWGKSNAAGMMNLLSQHLLDAAAVAGLIWDRYLASSVKTHLDRCCDNSGREFFALMCALHDVGKASPAFQSKAPQFLESLRAAGLACQLTKSEQRSWHHTLAGAVVVRRVLKRAGWDEAHVEWVWPLIAGHHGVVPPRGKLLRARMTKVQGGPEWVTAQDALVELVVSELGTDLNALQPAARPPRAVQLALLGGVIMADWIASDERHFNGIADPARVSSAHARERAEKAWTALRIRGGWDPSTLVAVADPVKHRFGKSARPAQAAVAELAERMPAPGLLVVEAPMGDGKTEAALVAAEVLARRFGADGIFVGMPTQATSDPMYTRVRKWADAVAPGAPVGLLHGKRRFNKEWHELVTETAFSGIDEYGCDDEFGEPRQRDDVPAEWFLGRKRGLLMPIAVGTVDHVLYAATRTRHVMLRHLGLAGRVVILDEVHAHDVYMSRFTMEALRWLADAGVPMVLLSATLAPAQRAALVRAYLQGALGKRDIDPVLPPMGYPGVLAVSVADGEPVIETRTAPSWRADLPVTVEILDERPDDGPAQVVEVVADALRDGGCALVVHNTVRRAQQTYLAMRGVFGDEAVLLHARLAMGHRVERTERVLARLGSDGARPHRMIVVATQLAEQSFDVDADLLVTDLAPIDLLLQRVGRLHRHERSLRPALVANPRVVVTGVARRGSSAPWLPPGSRAVYGDWLLQRAAALVMTADTWAVPCDVPTLVASGYGDEPVTPPSWADAVAEAEMAWAQQLNLRTGRADQLLLSGEGKLGVETLAGLHDRASGDIPDEETAATVVRDGAPSVEVVLVRHDGSRYLTLDGTPMGQHGEAVSDADVLERVLHSTIRLPAHEELTALAERELRPLPGWSADPWLAKTRALRLDEALTAQLGNFEFSYDPDLGLLHERSRR